MSLLERIRHSRGYGIHSPFVYRLVREVMMPRRLNDPTSTDLRDALTEMGVDRRTATRLQNYYIWAECNFWAVDYVDRFDGKERGLLIFSADNVELAAKTAAEIGSAEATICILHPDRCRRTIEEMIAAHRSTSIDTKQVAMLFFGGHRPKQHTKL